MNQVEVKRQQIQGAAHILGLVTILIFSRMVGDNGIAYLGAAYEIFSFLLILLGRNVPDALGRMLRSRKAKGQYRNVSRVRRYVMVFQGMAGILGSLILAAGGTLLMKEAFGMPHGAVLMLILAPVFFLRMINSVLLGYFQGEGTELPTAATAVLRQVLFLGLGFLFLKLLKEYGEKVSALLLQDDFVAMYADMGILIALGVSELLVLVFLLVIYRGNGSNRKNVQEGMRTTDSFGRVVKILYGNMFSATLIQLFMHLPIWIGLLFLHRSMADKSLYVTQYGVYYGNYLIPCMVLLLIIDILMAAASARVHAFLKKEEHKYARIAFQGNLHGVVALGLYFSVFVTAMGGQLAAILSPEYASSASRMLGCGAFVLFFAGVSDYFTRLLWLEGKWHFLLAGLGGMNVLYVVSLALFLNSGKLGVYSLVYAGLVGSALACAAFGLLLYRHIGIAVDWLRGLLIPAVCACLVGLLCLFFGKVFTPHLGGGITLFISLVVSFPVYWVLLLFFRTFREQELKLIPGSGPVRVLGQMLHLF